MWPYVDGTPRLEMGRPHMIQKNEWADHAPLHVRQNPSHGESAKIVKPGFEDALDAGHGSSSFDGREPASGASLLQSSRTDGKWRP
jgi:hypothetical protein